MINLLPPAEKEQLFLERKKKLVMILGYVIIISLICSTLILFSLKLYILEDVSSQKSILDITQTRYQASDLSFYDDIINKYNADLVGANTFYKKGIYFSDVIKTILDIQRPDGLFFNDISITNDEENNKIKVTITGKSDTRDNLLVFKNNIESNSKIKNAYFPANSWTKTKDINFYITLEIFHNEK